MVQYAYTTTCKGLARCCQGESLVIYTDTYHMVYTENDKEVIDYIVRTCMKCGKKTKRYAL